MQSCHILPVLTTDTKFRTRNPPFGLRRLHTLKGPIEAPDPIGLPVGPGWEGFASALG